MNRREIEEMRRRLADRSAAEKTDSPLALIVSAALLIILFVTANFI